MRTGEIYWVNLDPSIGDEIKKKRPVVIVNGVAMTSILNLLLLCPLLPGVHIGKKIHFLFLWNLTQAMACRKNRQLTVFRLGLLVIKDLWERSETSQTMKSTL